MATTPLTATLCRPQSGSRLCAGCRGRRRNVSATLPTPPPRPRTRPRPGALASHRRYERGAPTAPLPAAALRRVGRGRRRSACGEAHRRGCCYSNQMSVSSSALGAFLKSARVQAGRPRVGSGIVPDGCVALGAAVHADRVDVESGRSLWRLQHTATSEHASRFVFSTCANVMGCMAGTAVWYGF